MEDLCNFDDIKKELEKYLMENIATKDITKLLIKAVINLISIENTHWQLVAGRLLTMDLYKQAMRNRNIPIENIYSNQNFSQHFQQYIQQKKYYQNFMEYYSPEDIQKAGSYLKKEYDFAYGYTTALMIKKRYLLNPNNDIQELPQEMYMAIALFLAIPESPETRLETAFAIYDACATQKISLPTPTLMNARTNFHQLSSCFKLNVDDDLRSIYHNIENMAQISKFGGGI
ncbi:TPA: hypothetical protein DIC40_07480 [Patescibacteria group bacterium]|nr:hypothetical protein [Candidatus Gracilibacteria bacterium]